MDAALVIISKRNIRAGVWRRCYARSTPVCEDRRQLTVDFVRGTRPRVTGSSLSAQRHCWDLRRPADGARQTGQDRSVEERGWTKVGAEVADRGSEEDGNCTAATMSSPTSNLADDIAP